MASPRGWFYPSPDPTSGFIARLFEGMGRIWMRKTTTPDPFRGRKGRTILHSFGETGELAMVGLVPEESGEPVSVLVNTSDHQSHAIVLDHATFAGMEDDGCVTIAETWRSGAYKAGRSFRLTTLVHFLLNVTDEEINAISSRSWDATGQPTSYSPPKEG